MAGASAKHPKVPSCDSIAMFIAQIGRHVNVKISSNISNLIMQEGVHMQKWDSHKVRILVPRYGAFSVWGIEVT